MAKTRVDTIIFLWSLVNQYRKNNRFIKINKGTNKLKTANAGMVLGDIKGSTYDSNSAVAKIELINNTIFRIYNFYKLFVTLFK